MAKIMDPILPIVSILGYWAILLGSFGGLGSSNDALKSLEKLQATLTETPSPAVRSTSAELGKNSRVEP